MRNLSLTELIILCGFMFFLPLAEAPKNIFLYLFIIYWLVNSLRTKNFGSASPFFEFPLLLIVAISWVSFALSVSVSWQTLSDTFDFLSIAGIAIILARSHLSGRQIQSVIFVIIFGTAVAILEGELRGGRFPSLKSVGHVNQTAIYLAIISSLLLAFFITAGKRKFAIFYMAGTCIFLYLTVKTDSRNAVFAIGLATVLVIGTLFARGQRSRSAILAGLFLLALGTALQINPQVLAKQMAVLKSEGTIVDEPRLKLWKSSLTVASESPLWGHGVGTFSSVSAPENLRRIVEKSGNGFKESDYFFTDHAHNLTLNWIVERGMLATTLLYFWLIYILWVSLISNRRLDGAQGLWPVAVSYVAWTSFFCGLGNTSWHHEHGLLAGALIGLGISQIMSFSMSRKPVRGLESGRCTS